MTLRPLALLVATVGLLLTLSGVARAQPLDFFKPPEEKPKAAAPAAQGNDRITLTATLQPLAVRRGQELDLRINLDIKPGFHTYPTKQVDPNAQSFLTTVSVLSPEAAKAVKDRDKFPSILEQVGDYRNSATKDRPEPDLNIQILSEFEGKATIDGKFRVRGDIKPGKHEVVVLVAGQVCDTSCVVFSGKFAFTLTVTEGEEIPRSAPAVGAPPEGKGGDTSKTASSDSSAAKSLGFWAFILQGAGFGFISLFTPCVFPMIPITVSFFLKQSEKEHHKPVTMALVYSLTIVIVLTLAALVLIQTLTTVSQWPSTNFLIGVLFIVLALSLFGMYEIQLPASLARYTSAQEGRGGLIGTIFMALTFTIISFTCVAPFLGGFAGTTQQDRPFLEKLLGALSFSVTFALPFFVLALFPSLMRKLPKSGSWLNNVKVVMGFVELAAAFGFFRSAEVYLRGKEPAVIFTYDLVLGMWVALSIVCGLYLLGLFRLSHDTPSEHLGVPRLLVSCLFLGFGLYLLPGLFTSEKLRNRGEIYAWVDAFLIPETGTKEAAAPGAGSKSEQLVWDDNLQKSLADAAKTPGQLVFIDFTGKACKNCRYNERNVFTNTKVLQRLEKFRLVQLYTDTVDEEHQRNQELMVKQFGSIELPLYVILKPLNNGKYEELGRVGGKINSVDGFAEFLQKALDKNGGQLAATNVAGK